MRTLVKLVIYAAAVWLAVPLVGGLEFDGTWLALLGIAVIFAIVNAIVKPIVAVLSLPLVILTLGLFLLVVNAAMLAITIAVSDGLDLGLSSEGFGSTFLGALVISIVVWVAERIFDNDR